MEASRKVLTTKKDFDDFLYSTPYFAFLDILGFKALVQKNSQDKLVELYKNLFKEPVGNMEKAYKEMAQRKAEKMGENYTDSEMRMINISDSIMIWTKHGQPSALYEIIFAVQTLLAISLLQGLPLRGCITRQQFTCLEDQSVTSIIGKGLVHAYKTEQSQQWSGCIIDDEIVNYFRSIERVLLYRDVPSPIEREGLVFEYDIPFKDNKTKKGFAIDWSDFRITDDIIKNAFDAHNKKDERPESDTSLKIKNTIEFHNFCLNKKKEKIAMLEALQKASKDSGKET